MWLPVVGPDRLEKLKSVVNKLFTKFGHIVNEYYPVNEKGFTKGYIFLEYTSPVQAAEAVKHTNNHKLDKTHTFLVNLFTDFSKYEKISDKWEPPEPQPYEGQGDMHYYMLEPDAYDQFCVVNGPGRSVQIWQNTQPDPTCIQDRQVRWYHLSFHMCLMSWFMISDVDVELREVVAVGYLLSDIPPAGHCVVGWTQFYAIQALFAQFSAVY